LIINLLKVNISTGEYEVSKPTVSNTNLEDELQNGLKYSQGTKPFPVDEAEPYFRVNDRQFFATFNFKTTRAEIERCDKLEDMIPAIAIAKKAKQNLVRDAVKFGSASQDSVVVRAAAQRRLRLEFERKMILKKIWDDCVSFNESIDTLRHERYRI